MRIDLPKHSRMLAKRREPQNFVRLDLRQVESRYGVARHIVPTDHELIRAAVSDGAAAIRLVTVAGGRSSRRYNPVLRFLGGLHDERVLNGVGVGVAWIAG